MVDGAVLLIPAFVRLLDFASGLRGEIKNESWETAIEPKSIWHGRHKAQQEQRRPRCLFLNILAVQK